MALQTGTEQVYLEKKLARCRLIVDHMATKTPTKKFQRRIEDFVCAECGKLIVGDGYTNHCPFCLVSKHVDVQPGDRAEACHGLMDVVDMEMDHGDLMYTHQCRVCKSQRRIRGHKDDAMDMILATMKRVSKGKA